MLMIALHALAIMAAWFVLAVVLGLIIGRILGINR